MSILQTDPQMKLRLPADLKQLIENSSKRLNRSLNADVVARLQYSFFSENSTLNEPIGISKVHSLRNSSVRRADVSSRLTQLLKNINEIKKGQPLKHSHVAQAIGEEYAENVDDWFLGRQEPSFRQLEKIAKYLGGGIEWLQHGDAQEFPVYAAIFNESSTLDMSWLLDSGEKEVPTNIYFIRSKSNDGELSIVKKYGDWFCKTYSTSFNVGVIGNEAGSLAILPMVPTFISLYEISQQPGQVIVSSYLLEEDKFSALINGEIHPLRALHNNGQVPWWEDFWSSSRFQNKNYWEGWDSFCQRIQCEII